MTHLRDGQNWLGALQRHRIFTASPESALSPSTSLIPPSSPDASSIHGIDDEVDTALSSLADTTNGTPTKLVRRIANGHSADQAGFRTACIVGGTDLVVAISTTGNESSHSDARQSVGSGSRQNTGRRRRESPSQLRISSLSQFKTRYETSNDRDDFSHAVSSYKTLLVSEIDFPVIKLWPSPSNRHLAVLGESQVVVVELPRKGWEGLVSPTVECSAVVIGKYYHTSSAPKIVKARWHPLGFKRTSLVLLTTDGLLREYDVIGNPNEPLQECTCIPPVRSQPSIHSASRPAFTLDDDEDQTVASFAFGQDDDAWGSMTVYCLTRDGDIFALCPFLPKSSQLPPSLVPTLTELTETKLQFLDSAAAARDLSASDRHLLQQQYEAQLQWLTALQHCAMPRNHSHTSGLPSVHYRQKSSMLQRKVSPQGPFLLQPAPHELSWSDESIADDLVYITSSLSQDDGSKRSTGIVLIAYTNGKLDACLDVQSIEPVWQPTSQAALPALLVAQTIDLLGEEIGASVSDAGYGCSALIPDPDDSALVWCESNGHTFGLNINHMLSLSVQDFDIVRARTIDGLVDKSGSTTQALHGCAALLPLHDVYLGNALLKVAAGKISSCNLDGIDTTLDQSQSLPIVFAKTTGRPSTDLVKGPSSYQAFEGSAKFALPNAVLGASSKAPRLSIPNGDTSGRGVVDAKGQLTMSVQALKAVGQVTDKLDDTVRALISAGNAVQERLELHTKELPRQVGKYQVLDERVQTLAEVLEDDCNPRLAELLAEQKRLEQRADLLLRRVTELNQPDMSAAEKTWAEELRRVSNAVQPEKTARGFSSSLAQRNQRVRERLDVVREISSPTKKERSPVTIMGQQQKAQIYTILGQHNQELASAKTAVEAMQRKLAQMRHTET